MHALLDRLRSRRGEHRAVFVAFATALARLAAAQGRACGIGDEPAFGGKGAAAVGRTPSAEPSRRRGEARVHCFGEAG